MIVDYDPLPAVWTRRARWPMAPRHLPEHGDNVAVAVTDPRNPGVFGDADVIVRDAMSTSGWPWRRWSH